MAFEVYVGAHRERSRARHGLARLAVDLALAIALALLATHHLLRFTVTRVEPPRLPPERPLEPGLRPELPRKEPRYGCGGGPPRSAFDKPEEDEEEIPEEYVPALDVTGKARP